MSHAKAVAQAFAERCHLEPTDECVAAYKHAAEVIDTIAEALPALLGVRVLGSQDPEPYVDAHDQARDVCMNGKIVVSRRFCDHTIWDADHELQRPCLARHARALPAAGPIRPARVRVRRAGRELRPSPHVATAATAGRAHPTSDVH